MAKKAAVITSNGPSTYVAYYRLFTNHARPMLEEDPLKTALRRLAPQWAACYAPASHSAQGLTFDQYVETCEYLLAAVGQPDRADQILKAVLGQARRLGQHSDWVHTELLFEGIVADQVRLTPLPHPRKALLLEALESQLPFGPDPALDLYNQRLSRFSG